MKALSFICCSVLRRELEAFLGQDYPQAEQVFLDSMLHMRPEMLHKAINEALAVRPDRQCLLVYGDCHAHMKETGLRPHCARSDAINCGDLLLGRSLYLTYRNSKAFLFLPEWTERWREVFEKELGFSDPALAREFMQESQRRLVYVNTGLIPVPHETLQEIAEFFSMPMEIVSVSLDTLRQAIHSAMQHLEKKAAHES